MTRRPIVVSKTTIDELIDEDHRLTKVIFAFIASSVFWLVFGTLIGLYLAIKFVSPDLGVAPWLSFGRLRPIHTNVVFWGWTSLAMIALALYVVPRTSQRTLYSINWAWASLILTNLGVVGGTLALFSGVNNGGQEFREFIWPAMSVYALGLILLTLNLIITVSKRGIKEIYISNWYIIAAFIWTIVLVTLSYIPFYQLGLSQSIMQGYYMHNAVGMWFTPMVLGLTYYFLPKLLNKPIYSYSLGVLAFWTQMLFYTMIGAHHFIYSPVPWWLQTTAIVFSVGMFVPVFAGTGNFLLTMKGEFRLIARSYCLPFILVGVIFYFLVSVQGTFEAFRSLNLVWHFTNYTVAHSHLAMYGFVNFLVWGGIYALLPRLSGNEPPHLWVGIQFWFALIGLLIYGFALMVGGTLQGMSWLSGAPFIDSVVLMIPYWIWRAVGGTLMFASHIIFAYNVWRMWPTYEYTEKLALSEE